MMVRIKTNKETKQTVCTICLTKPYLQHRLRRGFKDMKGFAFFEGITELELPNEIIATVTCTGDDVYDEEVGKKLAFDKAIAKYIKLYNKSLADYKAKVVHRLDRVVLEPKDIPYKPSKVKR